MYRHHNPYPIPANAETAHCVGTFWTQREIEVIDALSKKQGFSHIAVLRQALRNYQLIVEGVPALPDKAATGIPGDILEHEYRHEHGLLEPGECCKTTTDNIMVSSTWVEQSHKARIALGHMLKLVEDRILVLDTHADMGTYHRNSQELGKVLKEAQDALA